jgi:hypothetical protein
VLLRNGAASSTLQQQQQQMLLLGQQYAVGWQKPAAELPYAAAAGQLGAEEGQLMQQQWFGGFGGALGGSSSGVDRWRLPRVLLKPATAAADAALKDVYEYVRTQVSH